ncbi:helix-turn-helix domain-containing protein [Plantibacter sp. VKM Ac-2885]|uniref:helix-turn-helix transcriptional regulator n=1 Tax=Plantibacter sp. VKM Ac-2885 TaxID=2783828 RepID=UPI00188BED43|nr:helix-turn-helix domain-containing protein [Plantibacter sp. VKM Ac-2885]MBF4512024.1 helix-turn-helix domain-containing protein [Plantibacter sp. VKM Ac-2885]
MTVINPSVTGSSRRLLDVKELAEQLHVSVATIYRKRSLSEPLPAAVKIGGRVRWRQDTVDAWVESQEAAVA